MDDQNGKCESNPHELEDDGVKKIDLTLKLGPSLNYNQSQQDNIATCRGAQGFSGAQSSNDVCKLCKVLNSLWTKQGNWNVGSTNYVVYPFPHHNSVTTTPNRKRPNIDDTKACKACGSNSTPLWRKGPDGPQTLCNACGLRHLRTVKRGGE